jgi:hypothetical protein
MEEFVPDTTKQVQAGTSRAILRADKAMLKEAEPTHAIGLH